MGKKYVFFITSLVGGGAERVMTTIANGLCQEDEILILTMTNKSIFYVLDERIRVKNLSTTIKARNKILRLLATAWKGIGAFFKAKREIRKFKPDAMLAFLGPSITLAIFCKLFSFKKVKLVVSERADPKARNKFEQWFERNFYGVADVIVCQSGAVQKFFPEKVQKKTTVIKNPICATAIPPYFTGERTKRIVGVGRLDGQKNFPLLIDAFHALDEQFDDYTLEIYGEGHKRPELEQQIAELGLEGRARLMGSVKQVMFSLSDASLFVLSSDFEGFPNVLVEAMATGLPVISTDFSPGIAREIVGAENGLVVPVRDAAALKTAMETILGDEQRIKSMSMKNTEIMNELCEEKIIARWKEVL